MELVERYRVINESFAKKLVFRFGIEAGFFSEYNNMILAMAYCLKRGIRFSIYSENAWFSPIGWTEFFESFCREEKARLHIRINTREVPPPPGKKMRLKIGWSRLWYGIDYFTWELWQEFRNRAMEQESFMIGELGIDGDLRDACKVLTDITWRYNQDTQKEVDQLIESVGLPDEYLGLHIRGGDKFIESDLQPAGRYFDEIKNRSDCRHVFVLTDDYRVIDTIRHEYPEWKIYTMCRSEERGYFHQEFMRRDPSYIRELTVRLFTSTDILRNSEFFIGTFTSNPGMYLGMRMDRNKCLGIGNTKWRLW
jgi:hypothetical protein